MEYQIILFGEAKQDVIEIVKWYDLKSDNLSTKFILQFDEAINKLSVNPGAFSYLYDNLKKIKLQKFPYIIFYKIPEQTVSIYGIIHTRHNPSLYKKRLAKLR